MDNLERTIHGSLWSVILLCVLTLIKIAFIVLLDGLFVFAISAAIVGFTAWLGGADSPRDAALTGGAIVGGIYVVVDFLSYVIRWVSAARAEIQKQRVEDILKS